MAKVVQLREADTDLGYVIRHQARSHGNFTREHRLEQNIEPRASTALTPSSLRARKVPFACSPPSPISSTNCHRRTSLCRNIIAAGACPQITFPLHYPTLVIFSFWVVKIAGLGTFFSTIGFRYPIIFIHANWTIISSSDSPALLPQCIISFSYPNLQRRQSAAFFFLLHSMHFLTISSLPRFDTM